jgi:hypothetical protein
MQNFINFMIASQRIEFFLQTDEINSSLLKYYEDLPREDNDTVIQVKDGNFHWGVLSNIDMKFIDEFSKVIQAGKGKKGKTAAKPKKEETEAIHAEGKPTKGAKGKKSKEQLMLENLLGSEFNPSLAKRDIKKVDEVLVVKDLNLKIKKG